MEAVPIFQSKQTNKDNPCDGNAEKELNVERCTSHEQN